MHTHSASELEARRPVWLALSDFFVDTEFDTAHWSGNAVTLAASPYSLSELDRILLEEVTPIAGPNVAYFLYPVISPVWAGFDAEWLCDEIMKLRQSRTRPGRWERALVWMAMRSLRLEWDRLQREVSRIRTATSPPG